MKTIALLLVVLSFSGGAFAQTVGLLLDKMPIGLKIYRLDSDGEKRVDTFLGGMGKYYQFRSEVSGRNAGNFTARQLFDLQGRRVKWTGHAHMRETWRPYDCRFQLGDCKVNFTNNYGRGGRWIYSSKLNGRTFTLNRRRPNEEKFRKTWVSKLGKYNLKMKTELMSTDGTKVIYWEKITKIVQP